MKIIAYEDNYRDDLIFMILEAKNALGRVPGLNSDLLDIKKNYMENGDMFWLAVDDNDRVIGSVGYRSIDGTDEVWLHRLFVKYNLKHEGIVLTMTGVKIGNVLWKKALHIVMIVGKIAKKGY